MVALEVLTTRPLLASALALLLVTTALFTALKHLTTLPPAISVFGPFLTLATTHGRTTLTQLANRWPRGWTAYGWFGVGLTLVYMAAGALLLVVATWQILTQPTATPIHKPQNMLVIPGVNQFLPLAAAPPLIAALILALIVHEGGHGLYCRLHDIPIDEIGVAFLSIIPMGAYVEPDEDALTDTALAGKLQMLAAGITNNTVLAVLAVALLFGPVAASLGVGVGAPVGTVIPGSPAADAGIEYGDRITAVNNTSITNYSAFTAYLANTPNQTITVDRADSPPTTLNRTTFISQIRESADIQPGTIITHVNDTPTPTVPHFHNAVTAGDQLTLASGNQTVTTMRAGARVHVTPNQTAAQLGLPTDGALVITALNETETPTATALQTAWRQSTANTTRPVVLTAYRPATNTTHDYRIPQSTHTDSDIEQALGLAVQDGMNGIVVADTGVTPFPAETYLAAFTGDTSSGLGAIADSVILRVYLLIVFPVAEIAGVLPFNFPGFVPALQSVYTLQGPLAWGGATAGFFAVNTLFWTVWLNLNLALFNALPVPLLDGGRMVEAVVTAVRENIASARQALLLRLVMLVVMTGAVVALLIMLFGAYL